MILVALITFDFEQSKEKITNITELDVYNKHRSTWIFLCQLQEETTNHCTLCDCVISLSFRLDKDVTCYEKRQGKRNRQPAFFLSYPVIRTSIRFSHVESSNFNQVEKISIPTVTRKLHPVRNKWLYIPDVEKIHRIVDFFITVGLNRVTARILATASIQLHSSFFSQLH